MIKKCLGLSLLLTGKAFALQLLTPIGGTPFADWSIVNYVDEDSTTGIRDYNGGGYTYDGHTGIDFTLPNFAAMDRGVSVYAAAAGVVTEIHDGEFDRYSRVTPNPGNVSANYIKVDHGNGVETWYWHLKSGSLQVHLGDTISAGQTIGQVGSSGLSTDAHLHFEVRQNGAVIDTQLNPSAWWASPIAYSGNFKGTLDKGVTKSAPSTADLVNRPTDAGTYLQAPNQQAYFWTCDYGVIAGDSLNFKFRKPDGSLFANYTYSASDARYGWWYSGINLPSLPDQGKWLTEFYINGALKSSDYFIVVPEGDCLIPLSCTAALLAILRHRSKHSKSIKAPFRG